MLHLYRPNKGFQSFEKGWVIQDAAYCRIPTKAAEDSQLFPW